MWYASSPFKRSTFAMSPWRRSVVRASWICLVGSTLFLFKTNTQTIPQLLPWEAGGSVKVKSDHHIVSKSSSSEKWWPLRAQESSIKAFPRWGGEGIAIQAILSYLEFASTKPDTPRDLLYPNDYPMPNVVYVIGSIEIFQQNNNKSNIALWVERHRRQLANLHDRKIRFEKVERLLKDALQYLTSGKHKHKHKHHHKYQRLYEATTRGGIPLILNLKDNRKCNQANFYYQNQVFNVPIFHMCGPLQDCNYSLPIPTYSLIEFVQSKNWTQIFSKQDSDYPWDSKIPQAVWRGSNNGHWRSIMLNITKALNGSLVNQTLFNVRKARPKTKHAIPFRDFQKYAAIIDIDGNSWSERFGKLLCMNSVVLKVHPEFVDYFYPTLQPWQHYIPVSTLEQLWNTTLWVLDPANKLLVRRIVSEAQDWCHHFMNYNHLIQHLLEILDWYVQELDKADPNWQNLWRSKFLNMNPAIHAWTKVSF